MSSKISLMRKHLTSEVEAQLREVVTEAGTTLDHVIASGVQNPDSSIGVYARDPETYRAFAPLFDHIIAEYHDHDLDRGHGRDFDASKIPADRLDPEQTRIRSTRIRVGRNLAKYPFPGGISLEDRIAHMNEVRTALESLTGDLAGTFYPLEGMDEATRQQLVADHFLFKQGDRFLEAAGINRDWPAGRGIFHNADKTFLVWVGEEDGLRIISMEMGDDVKGVFDRLARAVDALEQKLEFAYDERLGYLTSCPTNLGTALRGSVHVALPLLSKQPEFADLCKSLGVQPRGIHGEHSESEGGVYDISNARRLGLTEAEAVLIFYTGVQELLRRERELEDAQDARQAA